MSRTEDLIDNLVAKTAKTGTSATLTVFAYGAIAASTEIVAASRCKAGSIIFNDTDKNVYIKLGGGTASTTSFSVLVPKGGFYETPYYFKGAITVIIAAGASTGNIYVTEIN